jgi:hypothetical protein
MDLKKKLDDIIGEYGIDVLHLQTSHNRRCSCYDDKTGSSYPNCPYCFGIGIVPTIRKERIRDMDDRFFISMPNDKDTVRGQTSMVQRSYFFRADVDVQPGDLIIEVKWENDKPVYDEGNIYKLYKIDKQSFRNGEVIFKKASVQNAPINKKIRAIRAVHTVNQTFYELAEPKPS